MDKLGNITLHNADCMNLLQEFPDRSFDLVIVDPPYFDGPEKLGYYGTSKSSIGEKRPVYEEKHWTVPDKDYWFRPEHKRDLSNVLCNVLTKG